MPRKNRRDTVYNGSLHHVVQRGLNRATVFKEAKDYKQFKYFMLRYLENCRINVYNYCIMPNHIHILLYVGEGAHLPKFMQALSLAYSSDYNWSSYNFYSKGTKDDLITVNPLFETLGIWLLEKRTLNNTQ